MTGVGTLLRVTPPARAVRRLAVDGIIGVLLLASASVWGTVYWNRSFASGMPFFYQNYFEPAVMIACGKGFVIAQPQIPAMADFLAQQQDRFSCDAIPSNAVLGTTGLYQGAWRYLLLTVGVAWWVLGVSWSGMGPLFGILFGATIAAIYAVCRLGMGPPLAAICAAALCVSRLHLAYFPVLRDYSVMMAVIIVIAVLVLVGNLLADLAYSYLDPRIRYSRRG